MNNTSEYQPKGGVELTFPFRLHAMLEEAEKSGDESILTWNNNGRDFTVLKSHFSPPKYESMIQQFRLYGFTCTERGAFKDTYRHKSFIRGQRHLCKFIERKSSTNKSKRATNDLKSYEQYPGNSLPELIQLKTQMPGFESVCDDILKKCTSLDQSNHDLISFQEGRVTPSELKLNPSTQIYSSNAAEADTTKIRSGGKFIAASCAESDTSNGVSPLLQSRTEWIQKQNEELMRYAANLTGSQRGLNGSPDSSEVIDEIITTFNVEGL